MRRLTFENVKRLKRGFCIYKIYDSGRNVLYIGGTTAPARRLQDYIYMTNNKANKALVWRAKYYTVEYTNAGKNALLGREKRSIGAAAPRFNIYKKQSRPRKFGNRERPKIRVIGKRHPAPGRRVHPGVVPWYDVDIL
jgi:excinuclease UvrABC nuclease subunit